MHKKNERQKCLCELANIVGSPFTHFQKMLVPQELNAFVVLDHVRPIQGFLKIRSSPLTLLERSSRFLRSSVRCIHADVTSSIPLGAPRASGFLDLSARTSLLLRLFAALPFHSAILKPDLHLQ